MSDTSLEILSMLVISHSVDRGAIAEFHQSAFIDFSVWALLCDGLRVPPFDSHHCGLNQLQKVGLSEASWLDWFRKLVAMHHTGFQLESYGAFPFLEKRRKSPNYVPIVIDGKLETATTYNPDSEPILWNIYDCIAQLSSRSKIAAHSPPNLALISSPVDLWGGNSSVKDELAELWKAYKENVGQRVYHASDLHRAIAQDPCFAAQVDLAIRKSICEEERFLMFNFVNYPQKVIYSLEDSIIVGLPKNFPTQSIISVLKEAIQVV